jgi:predicted RNase H-like HicB family nuclease
LKFQIELDREEGGRWIAEIAALPGVTAYGKTKPEAVAKVKALALRVLANQVEKEKQSKPLDVSIACCRRVIGPVQKPAKSSAPCSESVAL